MRLLGALLLATVACSALAGSGKVVTCYYESWSVYHTGKGKFDVDQIDPHTCTHLVYAFAGMDEDFNLTPNDPWRDLCDNYGMCGYNKFTALKQKNPDLVVTLSVGGYSFGSQKFSAMVSDAQHRATFIASALGLLKEHNFDGLDVDWEFPTERGGNPDDAKNFVILMQELGEALHKENLIVTATTGAGQSVIDQAYDDIPALAEAVDFIQVMTFAYHTATEMQTNHPSMLYAYPGQQANLNANFSMKYWEEKGAPANKLVMGAPLYGACWTLKNIDKHGMFADVSGPSMAGPYLAAKGQIAYAGMCNINTEDKWSGEQDPHMNEPYAYNPHYGNAWCGYEDAASLAVKAKYVKDNGYAGMFVWAIDQDDTYGQCGKGDFPLIRSIGSVLLH